LFAMLSHFFATVLSVIRFIDFDSSLVSSNIPVLL
jgi:hypothetical protein